MSRPLEPIEPIEPVTIRVAPKMLRPWEPYVEPAKFIAPIYVEFSDGTTGVVTNLYDAVGALTDDVRFATRAVVCCGINSWIAIAFHPGKAEPLTVH